jgi:RNA-splicing ligase RtcB
MVMNNTKTEERKQHGANGALRQTLVVHPELKLSFNGLQANPYRSASCPLTVGGSAGKSAARVGGTEEAVVRGGSAAGGRGRRLSRARRTEDEGEADWEAGAGVHRFRYTLIKNNLHPIKKLKIIVFYYNLFYH